MTDTDDSAATTNGAPMPNPRVVLPERDPNACGDLLLMVHEGVSDDEIVRHRKGCEKCQALATRLGKTRYDD